MQVFLAKLVALFLSFLQSFVHVLCITNYSYLQNLVWYIFRLQLPQKVYSLQSKPRCCPKVTFPNFAKIFTSPVWEILIPKPILYLIHLGLDSFHRTLFFEHRTNLNVFIYWIWWLNSNTLFWALNEQTSTLLGLSLDLQNYSSTWLTGCPTSNLETLKAYILKSIWLKTKILGAMCVSWGYILFDMIKIFWKISKNGLSSKKL